MVELAKYRWALPAARRSLGDRPGYSGAARAGVRNLATGAAGLAPAAAHAHSIVRYDGSTAVYLTADATSLNTLTGSLAGARIAAYQDEPARGPARDGLQAS